MGQTHLKHIKYSWEDYSNDINLIVKELKNKDFKYITGIPKGGLVLAVHLANLLDLEYIDYREIDSDFYKRMLSSIIVVDDISDSGKTFMKIDNVLSYQTISLFKKESTQFIPNIWCRENKKDEWIIFPWEQ